MVAVHWLTAATVIFAIACVIGRELVDDGIWRRHMLDWHRDAGIIAWLLVLLRIILRSTTTAPDHGFPRPMQAIVAMGHATLYVALLCLPVAGYLMSGARIGSVLFLGLKLPSAIPRDRDMADVIEPFHVWGGWLFLVIVGMHAAIALWHHYVNKDDVLNSMWPFHEHLRWASTPERQASRDETPPGIPDHLL